MLSQNEEEQEAKYVRSYKRTDIFNLAPLPGSKQNGGVGGGKRLMGDRNKSSLDFDSLNNYQNSQSSHPPHTDRMKSDIFFAGGGGAGYDPSTGVSRRSSARDVYEQQAQQSKVQEYDNEQYEAPAAGHNDLYQHHDEQFPATNSRSISSVFEAASEPVPTTRGARRHYSQYQPTSDVFFQSNAPEKRQQPIPTAPFNEPSQWAPSVKMTSKSSSFSNIFGSPSTTSLEKDDSRRAGQPKHLDHYTFGMSSEQMNRDRRGKGAKRQSSTQSQIWF